MRSTRRCVAVAVVLACGTALSVPNLSSGALSPYDKLEWPGLNVLPVWTNGPGATWPQARYDQMKTKGFGVVRFMLHWTDFEPAAGQFNQTSLTTLDTAISRAKSAGLNVVLVPIMAYGADGMAYFPPWSKTGGDTVTVVQGHAEPYMRVVAARYASEPAVAGIEPVSEPYRWPLNQNSVLRMYQQMFSALRVAGWNKLLVYEPTYGTTSMTGAGGSVITPKTNVVFSTHYYYAGGSGGGWNTNGTSAGPHTYSAGTAYNTANRAALEQHLQTTLDWLRPQGVPLWIGEYGDVLGNPGHDAYLEDLTGRFRKFEGTGQPMPNGLPSVLGHAFWEFFQASGKMSATLGSDVTTWQPWANLLVNSTAPPPPPPSSDPVITAVGDYTSSATNSNDIAVKNAVAAANPVIHLGIGDFQYPTISNILSGFDKIWGGKPNGLWPRIRPTAGPTHDVTSCSDLGYQNYWGRAAMKGYSFDLGAWHIISLPSAAVRYGCDVAGVTTWLKADLVASAARCTLAFWQDPYWTRPTATHARESKVKPWVQALYDGNADVVLQASNHDYQRFAPQNMSDQADPTRGIRAFVVGTGGIGLYKFAGTAPNVQASNDTTYGALKMVLHPDSYHFSFMRAAGGSFTDTGSGSCH
jgi:cellulase (glycosyl hydrolase family 5)